ncbi:MAG TPA: hypothetical protein VK843_07130 [Planctomycetota bacterium]|nr:hypothetical protein [Planctomycetota bacterium]
MTAGKILRTGTELATHFACAALLRICFMMPAAGIASAQTDQAAPPKLPTTTEQHAARGFGTDSARVDSQITLKIPTARADEVYEYLKSKYVGRSDILPEQFPGNHLHGQEMSDLSIFTDRYFDTPTLQLHANKNSVRHRSRINTTNPTDRKSGRELVQMKVTPPGEFTLRNELKYEVDRDHAVTGSEPHPLIGLISGKLRLDFKKVFADAGIDPYALRHIFTIVQTRRRGYVNWDDKNIFSFSVDQGSANILWAEGSFSSVDMGLVEIAYTEADPERRRQMWAVRDAIVQDLQARFPELVQNSDSKYSIVLDQIQVQLPLLPLLLHSGLSSGEFVLLAILILTIAILATVGVIRRVRELREARSCRFAAS